MAENRAILYAFWLSSCSWRVRAALHLKGIPFEERSIDIVKTNQQQTEQFRAINPAQKVPALVIDNVTLVESMAIVQYLEDTRPEPALTPKTPVLRARMRELVEVVVSGIQPLQNNGLQSQFPTTEQYTKFTRYWTDRGLQTLEDLLQKSAGEYCVGDQITLADLCLVPQVYNAVGRHALDISKYPTVSRLYEKLLKEKVFKETHPKVIKSKM
ncbi:probable maleylacetoacetate isomerase 1 [Spodoptera frugiperda]|uniref:maleylacetoacetate isomerase n=1 Tax=Spodoptera frugiperda TaxID=7108 RepID=A0A9R0EFH2_SPOFR|nr:probable maleylacetoacetate isomerase 1 [Spodoptera frugiperda]